MMSAMTTAKAIAMERVMSPPQLGPMVVTENVLSAMPTCCATAEATAFASTGSVSPVRTMKPSTSLTEVV